MKNIQIMVTLGLIVCLAHGISFGGYSNITIYGNEDSGACTLTLTASLQADQVLFTEYVNNPNQDCTAQNIQFAQVYEEDPMGGNITLTPVAGTNTSTGSLSFADIVKANGTSCGVLGNNGRGDDFWGCRFKYGEIFFEFSTVVVRSTGKFNTNWTDLFFPNYGRTVVNSSNGVNLLTPNNTFPLIVARLPNGFFSWSSVVSDLQQPIYVIGTEQLSNQLNLSTYLADLPLNGIAVRKPDHSYTIYKPNATFYPFTLEKQGPNNATNIGLNWDKLLGSLNDCVEGCQVTIVLQKGNIVYLLHTSGITTQPPARNLRL